MAEPKVGPSKVLRHIFVVVLYIFNLNASLDVQRNCSFTIGGYQVIARGTADCSMVSTARSGRESLVALTKSYSTKRRSSDKVNNRFSFVSG